MQRLFSGGRSARAMSSALPRCRKRLGHALANGSHMRVDPPLSHGGAGDRPQRVERLAMAARLCRWLTTSRSSSADFVSAARAYAEVGGFADCAREALRAGDQIPDVAAAYGRLRELALA